MPSAADKLVVASYNVHGCVGLDGEHDVPRIARVLRELRADVIALQEVECQATDAQRSADAPTLAELCGLRTIWAPTHPRGDAHFGNALMTRLAIRACRNLDLSVAGYEPRAALDVDLDLGGQRLRVIATHLGLRPAERRTQVRTILDAVTHGPDTLTLLLGDINEWFMMGRSLRWLHAHFGYSPSLRTFPTRWPVFALDRIWSHPPGALSGLRTHVSEDSRRASDHYPVIADIAFGPLSREGA